MYAVYREDWVGDNEYVGPTRIYVFDKLYWFESNAQARVDEIHRTQRGVHAYHEKIAFSDPTIHAGA